MSPTISVPSVTASTFAEEVLSVSQLRPVLVDFWAAWCGPCKAIAPFVAEVARMRVDSATVVSVDVDAEPALAARYEIRSLPSLLIFHRGEVVDRITGLVSSQALLTRLDAVGAPAVA